MKRWNIGLLCDPTLHLMLALAITFGVMAALGSGVDPGAGHASYLVQPCPFSATDLATRIAHGHSEEPQP
jgi:hypothetical protein